MNRTKNDPQSNTLAVNFFRYRGLVIRSLSSDIDEGYKRTRDVVIAGIITLLLVDKFGGEIFAFQMCPKPLFAEIIKINHLRVRASKQEPAGLEDHIQDAYGILSRIHIFSSEQWSETKPSSKEDWMIVGNVYQAAVALYCILSLQSLSVLPLTPLLRASCTGHGQRLQVLLSEALSSPRIKRFLLWPLVVLGVEAVNSGPVMRAFVREQLPEMSRHIGSYVPLTVKGVLEKYWALGETRWDACFDRPYMLATQIAVDLSQLP
ncbi:uncharacterized protein ATNIH1004_006466 [Aspergillus tanneri]|uniref:Uncharacterized protein n=1 Tax=Aspergillus tanneri TaxID=1220188 RepID=A0A5M9ML76_9EURO|nr:uncharacterized protein ATNIH1004_006466 [Aspergillus tanneri]KAA8647765.1 hypothetical protein ATNIH1004_006466 [Aspergillus tanneri]